MFKTFQICIAFVLAHVIFTAVLSLAGISAAAQSYSESDIAKAKEAIRESEEAIRQAKASGMPETDHHIQRLRESLSRLRTITAASTKSPGPAAEPDAAKLEQMAQQNEDIVRPWDKVDTPEDRIRYWQGAIKRSENSIRELKAKGKPETDKLIQTMRLFIKVGQARIKTQQSLKADGKVDEPVGIDNFKRWILSAKTPLGIPIFNRADIQNNELLLWVRDGSFISPNLTLFADIGDAFAKHCQCDALTYVGIDLSHFGAGIYPALTFEYDRAAKRSVIRR